MEVEEVKKIGGSIIKKKRGRKRTKERPSIESKKKFFIDFSQDNKNHKLVVELLTKANKKNFGREVMFKDLITHSLEKLTDKDIERIQDQTITSTDKLKMYLEKHNEKHGLDLKLEDLLVEKLKI